LHLAPSGTAVLCLRFLWPPPPPASALFPSTTLFRSVLGRLRVRGLRCRRLRVRRRRGRRSGLGLGARHAFRGHGGGRARRRFPRDRKSTRLNSSHVKSSYAVFCLKKKTSRRLRRRAR